jgi:DNA mismatch endonuclease (patch repair protein)
MADTVSKTKRSEIMRSVRSKNSQIELKFRKALRKLGYKFKTNVRSYFGKPDIVLQKYKTVIFIDSCFWHGCKKHCRMPSSKKKYWVEKIKRNKNRDKEVNMHYKKIGWEVIRIWGHSLENKYTISVFIKKKLSMKKRSGRGA